MKIIEGNLISELSHLGHSHKLLYRIMWEMADPLGVVQWDIATISDAAGIKYHASDFQHFGKKVVELNSSELLMTMYLKTTIPKVSKTSPAHNRIWKLLEERWGATRDSVESFTEAWVKLGINFHAPDFPDIYTGERNIPAWLSEHRLRLDRAMEVDTPADWPEELALEFKDFITRKVAKSRELKVRSKCESNTIDPEFVLKMQKKVGRWMQNKVPMGKIINAIEDAYANNYKSIFL